MFSQSHLAKDWRRESCGPPLTETPDTRMIDGYGRRLDYLRLSVTDRCNLHCGYCRGPHDAYVPKTDLLSMEELARLCALFVETGIRKVRLTGGEPLVRKGIGLLLGRLGELVADGRLAELTITTNGTHLAPHVPQIVAAGIRRVNVSLDTLDPAAFRRQTGGDIDAVLAGIGAARAGGLDVKINAVAIRGVTEAAADDLIAWCGRHGMDVVFIELMPLHGSGCLTPDHALPLTELRSDLERRWTLRSCSHRTSGPAHYAEIAETGHRVGFIAPLSHGFCGDCNRLRLTASGKLYGCLAQADGYDLRRMVRDGADDAALRNALAAAVDRKPQGHDFHDGIRMEGPLRPMSATGG